MNIEDNPTDAFKVDKQGDKLILDNALGNCLFITNQMLKHQSLNMLKANSTSGTQTGPPISNP